MDDTLENVAPVEDTPAPTRNLFADTPAPEPVEEAPIVGDFVPETVNGFAPDAVEPAEDAEPAPATPEEPREHPVAEVVEPVIGNGLMAVDPEMEKLLAEKTELDNQIKDKQEAQQNAVISKISVLVKTYDIPVGKLVTALGGIPSPHKGIPAKVKYRDPVSGKTWAGRGKQPKWMEGKDPESFAV